MDIALIQCPVWTIYTPPYNLALLKAVLGNKGYEAGCFDFNIELYDHVSDVSEKNSWSDGERGSCWYDREFVLSIFKKYDLFITDFISKISDLTCPVIGFTVNNQAYFFTLELAKRIKERNPDKILIFGGPDCARDERWVDILAEPSTDAVCLGEGEVCLVNFMNNIKHKDKIEFCQGFAYKDEDGKIIDCGDPEIIEDLDSLPFADFSNFDIKKYTKKSLPILTSKGCIRKCSFCNETVRMQKFRQRSAVNIYSEIACQLKKYPGINEFHFNDSLINADTKVLNELCDLIIKGGMHIIWGGQASIRKEMTRDLLLKMKQAGCNHMGYGVESGSNKILRLMKKGYTADVAEDVLRATYDARIQANFNIIVGFPGETETEFQETIDFLKKTKVFAKEIWLNTLSLVRHSELNRDRGKWGIGFNSSGSDWYTIDGRNNYEERLRRLGICRDIIKEKARTDEYKEAALNLKLGDKFYKEGDLDSALNHYLKAKGFNHKDQNIIGVIKNRLDLIKDSITKGHSDDQAHNQVSFNWDIHYRCNYRCPYCWFYSKWGDLEGQNVHPSLEQLIRSWKNIYLNHGSIKIAITGGEPFLYPDFAELIKELSQMHKIDIITNLSIDIEDFVKDAKQPNIKIIPSFHLLFADFDRFVDRVLLLKDRQMVQGVSYIGWPPQIQRFPYYKERFDKFGINLSIQSFFGEYKGVRYPDGYTDEEKKIIMPNIDSRGGKDFQTGPLTTKGRLCAAGKRYGVIHPDGKVLRCGGIDSMDSAIGNLGDENFKLLDRSLPCTSEACPCNEGAFLLERGA